MPASVTAQPGTSVNPPRNAYDRLGFVTAAAESPCAVTSALDAAQRLVVPVIDAV